jgi:hypothetical protein
MGDVTFVLSFSLYMYTIIILRASFKGKLMKDQTPYDMKQGNTAVMLNTLL